MLCPGAAPQEGTEYLFIQFPAGDWWDWPPCSLALNALKMTVLGAFCFSEAQILPRKPAQRNTEEESLDELGLLGQELVLP